jgi:hypothetical protein
MPISLAFRVLSSASSCSVISPSGLLRASLMIASKFSSGNSPSSVVGAGGVGLGVGAGAGVGRGGGVGAGAGTSNGAGAEADVGIGAGAGVGVGVGSVLWQLISSAPDNETISIIMHKINSVFISLYLVFLSCFTLGKLIIALFKGLSILKKRNDFI